MPKLYNLARVYTPTGGVANLSLGAAVPGFLTFAQAGVTDGVEISYGIRDGANSELGTGTTNSGVTALTRAYVTASTNSGAKISLTGNAEVYITARAEDILAPDGMEGGMQVNGSMEVAQFGPGGTATPGVYAIDQWKLSWSGTATSTGLGQTPAGSTFPGFAHYMFANVITAKPTLDAISFAVAYQPIEGYRVARLAWGTNSARPMTIGFWSCHHRPGIYSLALTNGATNRSYVTTYTQAVADAAQYNVLIIPGDTIGAWTTDNGIGMYIYLASAMGTTYATATLNAWQAGYYLGATTQVNAIASTSDMSRWVGLIMLPGLHTLTASNSTGLMRPFDQEMTLCRRYLQIISGCIVESGAIAQHFLYPVAMRVTPSVTGGATGFAVSSPTATTGAFYQNVRSAQSIYMDARM